MAPSCSFVDGRDYYSAGPVLNSTSLAACCAACYANPACEVAVYSRESKQCYTKLDSSNAYSNPGAVSCVTNRTKPVPPTQYEFVRAFASCSPCLAVVAWLAAHPCSTARLLDCSTAR